MFEAHRDNLAELKADSRLRALALPAGHDFTSNDYLGIASSGLLNDAAAKALEAGIATGSGGSRLLRGNREEHEAVERAATEFFGGEAGLFMPTGFAANQALYAALPRPGDFICYDKLIHASVHDGIRLSRAESHRFAHNDPNHCEQLIAKYRADGGTGQVWIGIESLYSMDGDFAPLDDFLALARNSEAVLIVDEAHSSGIYGPNGEGLLPRAAHDENVIALHTFGKALGCEGAVITGPAIVREWLINHARPFIFSTAPSPFVAHLAATAIGIVRDRPELRTRLRERIGRAHDALPPHCRRKDRSQILPIIIGDNERTMELAGRLQEAGFDVRGIRPPTVPPGTSRLRITITNNVEIETIDRLMEAIASELEATG